MTYNGADLEARKNLAATIDTPVEVLRQLSEDPEAEVRCLVASNPNTPTEVLQKLGEEFPEAVTANPVFDLLAIENPDSRFIKLLLARSSTTSEEILARFAKSEDEEILCAVAKNVATPIEILQKLAVWYYTDEHTQRVHLGSRVHACVFTFTFTFTLTGNTSALYVQSGFFHKYIRCFTLFSMTLNIVFKYL